MKKFRTSQMILALLLGTSLCWSALGVGCAGGMSKNVPSAPGTNPFIVLRFTNSVPGGAQNVGGTPGMASFNATWRYAGGGKDNIGWGAAFVGEDWGTTLPCDVSVLALGNVDNLSDPRLPGASITWSTGQVAMPLAPMTKALQGGTDFRCGDVVTFMLQPNDSVPEKFSITWRVDSGQDETGQYSGPDTFAILDSQTQLWETQTGITVPYPYK